jgi:hypothetical protein
MAGQEDNCALLVYYAARSGNTLPTFRENLSDLIFKGEEPNMTV